MNSISYHYREKLCFCCPWLCRSHIGDFGLFLDIEAIALALLSSGFLVNEAYKLLGRDSVVHHYTPIVDKAFSPYDYVANVEVEKWILRIIE
jgi:hypothetical protein